MRKLFLLFSIGVLLSACVDKDYNLSDLDTDGVTIGGDGSEFRIPLATVTIRMDELGEGADNIEDIFDEADIWLPAQLPDKKNYVDIQALQNDPDYTEKVLDGLIDQMLVDEDKLGAVAKLLSEKYIDTFLNLLPPGTQPSDFIPVFTTVFRSNPSLREELSGKVREEGHDYLSQMSVQDIRYDIGRIDLSSDVVDMLVKNLDAESVSEQKNTLHIYGSITSALPVSLTLLPRFSPTDVNFSVTVTPDQESEIPATQLYADDLRQIIDGAEILVPVTLERYFPGTAFSPDQTITINLRLLKRGGLKLDI